MKVWSYWFPDLALHVPGCPNVLMVHELRRSAQALLSASRAWKVDLALKPVPAMTDEIPVAPDDAAQDLVRIEAAWLDGRRLTPTSADSLDAEHAYAWYDRTGPIESYLEMEPGTLRLFPLALDAASIGLKLRISVSPSESAEGLPDDLAIRYRDHMHVGAKARLMLMPGKPWTNIEMAGVYAAAFSSLVESAKVRADMGHVNARIPSRPNWC